MRTALAFVALLALGAPAAVAQNQARPRLEARLDGFAGPMEAAHLGGGIALPVGTYARLAAIVGAGAARVDDENGEKGDVGFGARIDLLGRFHFDPVRQFRWGPYAAAGISVHAAPETCCDAFLSLLLGVEGPHVGGRSWAFELGFGGGVRAALVLRGGGGRWR